MLSEISTRPFSSKSIPCGRTPRACLKRLRDLTPSRVPVSYLRVHMHCKPVCGAHLDERDGLGALWHNSLDCWEQPGQKLMRQHKDQHGGALCSRGEIRDRNNILRKFVTLIRRNAEITMSLACCRQKMQIFYGSMVINLPLFFNRRQTGKYFTFSCRVLIISVSFSPSMSSSYTHICGKDL